LIADNSGTGTGLDLLQIDVTTVTSMASTSWTGNGKIMTLTQPSVEKLGVIVADTAKTEQGTVWFRKSALENFSGLTAGTIYYIDDTGQPTTEASSVSVPYGVALSTDEVFID
jgi:hypothetical protein